MVVVVHRHIVSDEPETVQNIPAKTKCPTAQMADGNDLATGCSFHRPREFVSPFGSVLIRVWVAVAQRQDQVSVPEIPPRRSNVGSAPAGTSTLCAVHLPRAPT